MTPYLSLIAMVTFGLGFPLWLKLDKWAGMGIILILLSLFLALIATM